MTSRRRGRWLICGLLLALIFAAGAFAAGQATSRTTISACQSKRGGALYVAKACKKGDRRLSWNKGGQPGLPGAKGDAGPAGAAGVSGPAGASGATGAIGPSWGVAIGTDPIAMPDTATCGLTCFSSPSTPFTLPTAGRVLITATFPGGVGCAAGNAFNCSGRYGLYVDGQPTKGGTTDQRTVAKSTSYAGNETLYGMADNLTAGVHDLRIVFKFTNNMDLSSWQGIGAHYLLTQVGS